MIKLKRLNQKLTTKVVGSSPIVDVFNAMHNIEMFNEEYNGEAGCWINWIDIGIKPLSDVEIEVASDEDFCI